MNAERVLIAAECIGDGRFFIDRASKYAAERKVFGRPIGSNQVCSKLACIGFAAHIMLLTDLGAF